MRIVHPQILQLLQSGRPFQYAHLVKFQRPFFQQGLPSRKANRFAYLTDGSFNIQFDDLSQDRFGQPNGPQIYIANKIQRVPSISQYTKARATNHTIQLNAGCLGSIITSIANITKVQGNIYDIELDQDPRDEPFIQGDKLIIQQIGTTYQALLLNFRHNNVIRVQAIQQDFLQGNNLAINITLGSQQIKNLLQDSQNPRYASFINRQVLIYRAYLQQGQIVGIPLLLFKGIVTGSKLEDTQQQVKIYWNLSSHWGDFSQVINRITSDDFHRGLDINGIPQPSSTVKPQYAYDKGFIHSQTSINTLSTYTVQVQKQDVKSKKGFFGIGAKVKVKKYLQAQQRHTQLDFQLASKSIPVIYGVRQAVGIPIFADTLNNDSSEVYIVHVLSQGQIAGVYDVYIDGKSLICNDQSDQDVRGRGLSADSTVQIPCSGRADRGDVLTGSTSASSTYVNYYDQQDYEAYNIGYNYNIALRYSQYIPPTQVSADIDVSGVTHRQSIRITVPQTITLDVFTGKQGQQAASSLVSIAKAKNFKIQNQYWRGSQTSQYWGPNHRLLDSAYIVGKYKIAQGQTTIPQVQFIVKGKILQCYNYDYSYQHYQRQQSQSADNFSLGDTVSLYSQSGILLNDDVQIIDKWKITVDQGRISNRFRFSQIPNLGYQGGVPTAHTKFYMQNQSLDRWTMITYNYVQTQGQVPQTLQSAIQSIAQQPVTGSVIFNVTTPPPVSSGMVQQIPSGRQISYGLRSPVRFL